MKKLPIAMLGVTILFALLITTSKANYSYQPHPAFLSALADLRAARWLIEHKPGSWTQTGDEIEAVRHIDAVINEMKKKGVDDGKDIMDHPKVDEHNGHDERLHEAADFLKKAREDVSHEDNKFGRGLQLQAYMHIDAAIEAVKKAFH
jgi:hypothetical protein